MAEPTDIFLDNLKETLSGAQRYFLSGSVSALFILLLAARGELAAGAVEHEIKVPVIDLNTTQFAAALIALAIYILSGWMIFSCARQVEKIKDRLALLKAEDLLNAALTYPSMLTPGKARPAISTLLVGTLGTLALFVSFYANQGFKGALMTGVISSHPYFFVSFYLLRWPLDAPNPSSKA